MCHRAAWIAVAALSAVIALGAAAHGYQIEMKRLLVSSYQTGGSNNSSLQLPGSIDVLLNRQNPDGSLSGVLTQGSTRITIRAVMRGCPATSTADDTHSDEIDVLAWSWGSASQGRHLPAATGEEVHIPSPKNAACTLVLQLPKPPPPPPTGPGSLTTRPKPPEPIVLRPSSNDPGPGGDEPRDPTPGRSTEGSQPPPGSG